MVLAAFLWGLSFVSQKAASAFIGPFTFNAIRMLLGSVALIPFTLKSLSVNLKKKGYLKKLVLYSFVVGSLLFLASLLQQIGIERTSAGKAGFLTSLYILLVPVISLFFGKKSSLKIWICVLVGLLGAFLISYNGEFGFSSGDIYLLLCALAFAFHIIFIEKFTQRVNPVELSMFQFFFAGVLNLFFMFPLEKPELSSILDAWLPLLYSGIVSCSIAYTLQSIGQKYVESSKASLALSLESVFALLGGMVILHERLRINEWIGSALLFLSVIFTQIDFKKKKAKPN